MCKEAILTTDLSNYRVQQRDVVTKMAYLIGTKTEMLYQNYGSKRELLESLEQNDEATVIRTLCSIRTKLILHYEDTENEIVYNLKNLYMQDLYKDDFKVLKKYDADITKSNCKVNDYIITINSELTKRIDRIKDLFPDWIKWAYIKALIIMPKGLKKENVIDEAHKFIFNKNYYPFTCYINWKPKDVGNMLYNDKKFATILFEQNGEYFYDNSKVLDASESVKMNIYDFIERNKNIEIVVDCENSNPFKLAAVLTQLDNDLLSKINKISLYDDEHTTKAWQAIGKYTQIPVEYYEIERIKEDKSLVDIRMVSGINKSFYRDGVTAFIMLSSDSDFWGVISSLPEAEFLVMIENKKCGHDIKEALTRNGTYYCSLDEFSTGHIKNFKNYVLRSELQRRVGDLVNIDINALIESIYSDLRMDDATKSEKENFFEKYIKNISIKTDKNRIMTINVPV